VKPYQRRPARRAAIVLRQSRNGRVAWVEARAANLAPCLIGIEVCVGAHHLSCKSPRLGHNPGLIPLKSVRRRTKLPVFVNSREVVRSRY
jgi:hypothetical protein